MLKYPIQKKTGTMAETTNNDNLLLEPYLSKVDALRSDMLFRAFKNDKPYSFDYRYKEDFQNIQEEIKVMLEKQPSLQLSPSVKNMIPIFLPTDVARIAFFAHRAKSVRIFNTDTMKDTLWKQARKQYRRGEIKKEEILSIVDIDLKVFKTFDSTHDFKSYRFDSYTNTVQFNAYDKDDNVLIEKSYVLGGLVFDMKEKDFEEKIVITYPRHRKQRSDKKDNYLPLKLIKIRGV